MQNRLGARKVLASACLLAIALTTVAPVLVTQPILAAPGARAVPTIADNTSCPAPMLSTPRMLVVLAVRGVAPSSAAQRWPMDSYPLGVLRATLPPEGCADLTIWQLRAAQASRIAVVVVSVPRPPRQQHTNSVSVATVPATPRYSGPVQSGIAGGDECPGVARSQAFAHGVGSWVVPAGCFAGVWSINPYAYRIGAVGFGWCDWWPEALWGLRTILSAPRHSYARIGAVMWFAPGEQGAGSAGHWAYVEAIGPVSSGRQWLLISEMNDTWRGAGWAKVNFRFVYVDGGATSFLW